MNPRQPAKACAFILSTCLPLLFLSRPGHRERNDFTADLADTQATRVGWSAGEQNVFRACRFELVSLPDCRRLTNRTRRNVDPHRKRMTDGWFSIRTSSGHFGGLVSGVFSEFFSIGVKPAQPGWNRLCVDPFRRESGTRARMGCQGRQAWPKWSRSVAILHCCSGCTAPKRPRFTETAAFSGTWANLIRATVLI